ncbi:MAG: hypothetical protein CVU48_05065 [Candidatus Cloacimonetes bacterium HGW-Cloacimonetes-1]|jgi:hypothetical protein|nr:MAG: hypothetical protein CVU48_05065 [Candidatus Cloacimonetes bacterium HGW-Cloacimonetes-1]
MLKRLIYAALLVFVLILLGSCEVLSAPGPTEFNCSLNSDGSNFSRFDNRLFVNMGKQYYISDDLVFYLSTAIRRGSIYQNTPPQVISAHLRIIDTETMAIDIVNQKIYCATSDGIYRLPFYGSGLTNLSPAVSGSVIAPVLSTDRNYLTAVRDGHILRLNLNSGEWIEEAGFSGVTYATYVAETNQYYYYATTSNLNVMGLWRATPGSDEPTLLMNMNGAVADLKWDISHDQLYFGLYYKRKLSWRPGVANILKICDRAGTEVAQIDSCYSFAFAPSEERVCYSQYIWGMADINMLDLTTGTNDLIFDGYFTRNTYSYSISNIVLRHDGSRIFYSGSIGYRD